MRNAIRRLSAFITATMLLSSTVMAMPGNSVIMKNRGFSIDAIFAGVNGIQEALDQSEGKLYFDLEGVTNGFQGLFTGEKMTQTQKDELSNIEYTKADGTKDTYARFDDTTPIPRTTPIPGITVTTISAVNSTTIDVTFSDGVTMRYPGQQLVTGNNHVQFEYKGRPYTGEVTYQPAVTSQAAVEKVEFVNYRYIKVTFNKEVDNESAADPANYYFEIVDGNAGYGVLAPEPALHDSNQLSKIETQYPGGAAAWWEDGHIAAINESGKTVVNIYLPEDARFTNVEDDAIGTYPVGTEDAEMTLDVELKTSKNTDLPVDIKALIKNTSVNVGVRNVKDADGKFTIDTAVMPIKILDEVKPELIYVGPIANAAEDEEEPDVGPKASAGKPRELGTFDLLRESIAKKQLGEQLEFIYSEPVFDGHGLPKSDTEFDRDLRLYVNGKKVASLDEGTLHNFMTFQMGVNSTYEGSKTVVLNVQEAVKATGEPFRTGFEYIVRFVGVTDLAGNIEVSSEHSFNVKFHDDPAPDINIVKPVVLGVDQVADNMFRVEFNRAGVQGKLVIENPDGEGRGLLKADVPASVQSADKKHYYSYVAVPSWDHEFLPTLPGGVVQIDEVLVYDGQNELYRNVRVEQVRVENDEVSKDPIPGDSLIDNKMTLIDDIKAPVALQPDKIPYNKDLGTTISIPVKDITPWVEDEAIDYWVSPIAYVYNYDGTKRFGNEILGDQSRDREGAKTYLPIKVSYVDANGATHEAFVSNYDLRPYDHPDLEESDLNRGQFGNIVFDGDKDILTLNLAQYKDLLFNVQGDVYTLVPGTTYKIEIPKGYFTDAIKDIDFWDRDSDFEFGGKVYDILNVDDGRDDDHYLWFIPGDSGLGYTSAEQKLNVDVEPKPAPEPELEYVPQTSKQLINYDEPSNSMRIEFTGTIDVDTLKDKDNYTLDGKTLAQWDAELGTDTKIEYVVDNTNPDNVRQFAVFEIPQDSIQESGDYDLKVEGVSHPNGGTMTPVETVVRLHDNYRPVVVDSEVTGDRQIKLTFNEPIRYFVDTATLADPHAVANNFKVTIGGVTYTVDTAVLPLLSETNRDIILNLGNIIPAAGEINVEVVKDQNGNILVIDYSTNKNPLKLTSYTVER